ncbi:hypothetical protein [Halomonas heilongjiangensis]|uniref:Uncharacterized protein n=1 Tax=Halomonas heilongjiangensis TaxID=1387883 RepID=A0A2N7TTY5_9GAMM|nr:hypothetical protein [Halomonas heilongjiangensis]PMR71641.1 hypothetical protein C1H66_01625 [Halomonas heilongjiangensis]PXX87208.1 hypothetical protein CR158_19455 [Halomonas heilongjiangensis]
MPVQTPDDLLAAEVRRLLETMPEARLPITYHQVADALGLTPPRTIQRVAQALEALMREDADAGRPFIAALVVSRRGDLPGRGFFDLAVELGRFPADPARQAEAYRDAYRRAMAARG